MTREQKDKLENLVLWGIIVLAFVYFSIGLSLSLLKV